MLWETSGVVGSQGRARQGTAGDGYVMFGGEQVRAQSIRWRCLGNGDAQFHAAVLELPQSPPALLLYKNQCKVDWRQT